MAQSLKNEIYNFYLYDMNFQNSFVNIIKQIGKYIICDIFANYEKGFIRCFDLIKNRHDLLALLKRLICDECQWEVKFYS